MANAVTIRVGDKGDFRRTFKLLRTLKEKSFLKHLDRYGQMGVDALAAATPKRSGLTASSWSYDINDDGETLTITWNNSNVQKGYYNVALMIQYGHGTGTGGWVEGIDYINPALQPVFDKMVDSIWMEIKKS